MTDIEKILAVAAIGGLAWIAFARYGSQMVSSGAQAASDGNVPWYLQYNTQPPAPASFANGGTITTPAVAIPSNASGIENSSGGGCTTCSMFGASWGSQY